MLLSIPQIFNLNHNHITQLLFLLPPIHQQYSPFAQYPLFSPFANVLQWIIVFKISGISNQYFAHLIFINFFTDLV